MKKGGKTPLGVVVVYKLATGVISCKRLLEYLRDLHKCIVFFQLPKDVVSKVVLIFA